MRLNDLECQSRTPDDAIRVVFNMVGQEPEIIGVFRLSDDSEIDFQSLPHRVQDKICEDCLIYYTKTQENQ